MNIVVHAVAQAPPSREGASVSERANAILDALQAGGSIETAQNDVQALCDSVIGYAPLRASDAFVEAAYTQRLLSFVSRLEERDCVETLQFLRNNDAFAKTLMFVFDAKQEQPRDVLDVLHQLRPAHRERLNEYANLAVAVCVVHDKPLARNFNENRAQAPGPLEIFEYFLRHEQAMQFGLTNVPPELLIYVVDVTASIPELEWAVSRYTGDQLVGARFFDIAYDFDHYRTGAPKKVTLAGWNLPNILQYGGVCADQAYFATTVGKAIGVPTAYTVGRSADTSHAWVGFLQADRRSAWWNFDAGRYEAYMGTRGIVLDPQTRRMVDDSRISLLADFAMSDQNNRFVAASLTDAAERLDTLRRDGNAFEPAELIASRNRAPARLLRSPDSVNDQLELLEAGLTASPGYARGWFQMGALAADGVLSLPQKKRWAGVLDRLCGSRYPEFSLDVLMPMIQSVDDVEEQNALWNAAFAKFQRRLDLAAEIRMAQGEMWEKAGQPDNAGDCYLDVINRYANAGPMVHDALAQAEALLRKNGEAQRVPELYIQTWNRVQPPAEMAGMFVVQSNWYRIGAATADRLQEAGYAEDAARIRVRISGR